MALKFDAAAAEEVIWEMYDYCSEIVQNTRDIQRLFQNLDGWNDRQTKAFKNNMTVLAEDLNEAVNLEGEYMETFRQRVLELKR